MEGVRGEGAAGRVAVTVVVTAREGRGGGGKKSDYLNEGSSEELWKAAKLFMAKGPSATLQYLKDEPRAWLYAYDAQAVDGPCPRALDVSMVHDPSLRKKQEAWKSLDDMPGDEAKRRFVELLTVLLPEWKDWYMSQGKNTHAKEENDEAGRILSEFTRRTGFVAMSRL